MSTIFFSSAWLRLFSLGCLGSASFLANLLWTTVVWGQSAASSAATTQNSFTSKQTQHSLAQQFPQLEPSSTNAADLLPICENDSSEISHTSFKFHCQAQTEQLAQIVEPTEDRLRLYAGDEDPNAFIFGLGSRIGEPTALQGVTRLRSVTTSAQIDLVFPVAGFLQQGLGPNQRLLLEIIGDFHAFGLDFSYTYVPSTIPGAFSVNAQTVRSFAGVFEEGDPVVKLPGGTDTWLHRNGAGFEYNIPFSSQFSLASALNYQLVSVRPGAFTNRVTSVDEQGNPVTVSDDGQDTLLTFNLAGLWANLDDLGFPTKGSRLRFGVDTSLPIGDASISFGRFSGNFSQYIPFNLFGFSKGPRTLILNLQAGTMVGDVPPYEAFTMGGNNTVRGYRNGQLGSGSSFVLLSAEYRFPIVNDIKVLVDFDLQGSLFFDYGTDLDTADQVIGKPAIARNKKGDGFGYGLGLHAKTDFGLIRAEFAFNDDGDFITYFTVGDRY